MPEKLFQEIIQKAGLSITKIDISAFHILKTTHKIKILQCKKCDIVFHLFWEDRRQGVIDCPCCYNRDEICFRWSRNPPISSYN